MSTKPMATQPRVALISQDKAQALMAVINNGCGEELLNLRELKATGCHPFSDSTRRRKISNDEYPKPIKISPQMDLWKSGEMRIWRQDPIAFKTRNQQKGAR